VRRSGVTPERLPAALVGVERRPGSRSSRKANSLKTNDLLGSFGISRWAERWVAVGFVWYCHSGAEWRGAAGFVWQLNAAGEHLMQRE
jgi:hypothetical protein